MCGNMLHATFISAVLAHCSQLTVIWHQRFLQELGGAREMDDDKNEHQNGMKNEQNTNIVKKNLPNTSNKLRSSKQF